MLRELADALRAKLFAMAHPRLATALGIPSHLTVHERVALMRLAHSRTRILEIGSYLGASACCFGAACKEAGVGRVYCVDTWHNDAMTEGGRDTLAEFRANTEPFSEFIVPLRGYSADMAREAARMAGWLDLLFIDGDHSYAGVKGDWSAYRGLLRAGSLVVFHDSGWAEGVQRIIAEDVAPLVINSGKLPNMWWGTLKAAPC